MRTEVKRTISPNDDGSIIVEYSDGSTTVIKMLDQPPQDIAVDAAVVEGDGHKFTKKELADRGYA